MHRLESDLRQALRPVSAPPELWDRLQGAPVPPSVSRNRGLVWAMAAAVFSLPWDCPSFNRQSAAGNNDSSGRSLSLPESRAIARLGSAKTGLGCADADSAGGIHPVDRGSESGSARRDCVPDRESGCRIAGVEAGCRISWRRWRGERQCVLLGHGRAAVHSRGRQRRRSTTGLQALPSGLV